MTGAAVRPGWNGLDGLGDQLGMLPVRVDQRDARVGDHPHVADREIVAQDLVSTTSGSRLATACWQNECVSGQSGVTIEGRLGTGVQQSGGAQRVASWAGDAARRIAASNSGSPR
jgi:hypothetical protein